MTRFAGRVSAAIILASSLLLAAGKPDPANRAAPDDKAIAADLQAIQGVWETTWRDPKGAVHRLEKNIKDNTDAVSLFAPDGKLLRTHTARFKLEHRGAARVFSFDNFVVTFGPDQGPKPPGFDSFLYRLTADAMYEVWGVLDGDPSPPHIITWTRVKAE